MTNNSLSLGDNGYSGLPGQKGESGPSGKNFNIEFFEFI